jgi:hypothetical protein
MRKVPVFVDENKAFVFIIPERMNIILLRSEGNTNNFAFAIEIQVKFKLDVSGPETILI